MARKPSPLRQLTRALENSETMVAAINEHLEIAFANDACRRWLGVSAEEITGRTLAYASGLDPSKQSADSLGSRLAGLCPPPELLDEQEAVCMQGFICTRQVDPPRWKEAVWTRLGDTDSSQQLILMLGYGPERMEPAIPHDPRPRYQILHDALAALDAADRRRFSVPSLAGHSDQAKRIRRQVDAVAANRSDCLIIGPAGSGKEHIARTIFHQRRRDNSQLVPIHCVIADSQLLQESIKHWAFDQQDRRSTDWLLLLDVDRLNVESQNELLGYTRLPEFPMRIIATSQLDLLKLANKGCFSMPLALHLSVQVIHSTPLSERPADIPLISQVLIETCNQAGHRQVAGLSDEVLELFYEYSWPGNIDELKQVIESAHERCQSHKIQPQDLPDLFHQSLSAMRIGYRQVDRIDLDEFMAGVEQQLIERALHQAQGNRTQAAELLGITRARLMRKADGLGIIEKTNKTTTVDDGRFVDESAFREAE